MDDTRTLPRLKAPLWWWVVPVLLLTFWLGAHGLNADPIWGDESSSIRDAGGSFYGPLSPVEVWERVAGRNAWHAPGYFILLNLWGRAVGWGPAALRTLSLLFGLLAAAMTYRLGADLISRRAGVYAAAILGTSVLFVHYHDQVRMYTLIAFVSVLTLWAYLRVVHARREPPLLLWLALLGGATAALYTHYLAAIPLLAIGLYHLVFAPKNRRWLYVVGVMLLAGVLFLPWANVLRAGVGLASEAEQLHERALDAGSVLLRLAYLFGNGAVPLAVVGLGLALLALRMRRRGVMRVWFFALAVLGLMLVANALFQIIDERRMRYLIALWPLLALLVAVGIAWLERWRPLALVMLAIWMSFGVANSLSTLANETLDGYTYLFPVHRVAASLRGLILPDDVVINTLPNSGRLSAEYEDLASYYFTPLDLPYVMFQMNGTLERRGVVLRQTLTIANEHKRIWLAYAPDRLPEAFDEFLTPLSQWHVLCQTVVDQPSLRIDLYTRSTADCG
jgi:hypothetical protein